MKFGIKTPPQHCSWQQMLAVWQATDQVEIFDSCWNFDHFYPLVGEPKGPCMEAWVTLTALASRTKRVRVGCMVNGTPYRHPALTANMAASLDIVTNGRLNLGLGAGWHEPECAAYGIDLLPMKQRMDRFEENVQIVKSLLSNETTNFAGHYYQISDARCEPKGPPDQFQHKRSILLRYCDVVGRNIDEIECSVQIALPANQSPDASVQQAQALADAGVDTVIFSLRNPYDAAIIEPLGKALEQVS